ncbi:MAG: DMT family transporter [Nanoarchaeota archaeon]|nr:DMT family transporter [Nanoarchaeota archaeon]
MIQWYILALVSAVFSAAAAISQKKVLFKEKVLIFTTILGLFNLILVIPFFVSSDFTLLTSKGLFILFIKSILEAGAFLCIMAGIKNLEISKALPLLVLTPGIVAVLAFIFLGETLTPLEISGMLLLIAGTYILETKEKIIDSTKKVINSKGRKYILIALGLMVIKSLLDKTLLKNLGMPVDSFMAFQHLFLAVIFLTVVILLGKSKEIKPTLKNSWPIISLIAVFTIAYRFTEFSAIKDAPVALVLSLKRISVFLAVLIGGKLFKERYLLKRIIATLIMIAGALLIING